MSLLLVLAGSPPGLATEIPRPSVVDPKESTSQFVQLFDETCFQHRQSLEHLRELATARGWPELFGPFPYRINEGDPRTVLAIWGVWAGGVPHQVSLNVYDGTAPAVTCSVISAVMDKAMLPDRMMTMLGLKLHKRMKTEDNDVTLLKNEEHGLRIACFTVLPELALIGSCSLATVLQPETTP